MNTGSLGRWISGIVIGDRLVGCWWVGGFDKTSFFSTKKGEIMFIVQGEEKVLVFYSKSVVRYIFKIVKSKCYHPKAANRGVLSKNFS